MLQQMKLAKKVRELAKLNAWTMHKLMNKKTVQAYLSLERSAKRISLEDLYSLEKIFVDHGCGSRDEFQEIARKLAAK